MKVTKVYLCGPMSGLHDLNREQFAHYEKMTNIVKQYEAVNPHSFFKKDEPPSQTICRKRAIQEMLKCDLVAVLPGWKDWPDSFLHDEMALSRRCGIPLIDADTVATGPQPLMESVLGEADRLINKNRNLTYGHPKEAFDKIAGLWEMYLSIRHAHPFEFRNHDVANMFILSKMARTMHKPMHRDSWVDIAGYAGAAARALHIDP